MLTGRTLVEDYVLGEVAVEEDKDRFSSQLIEVEQNETAPNIISRLIGQRRREG